MQASTSAESTPGLNSVGGHSRKAQHGTFSRAARTSGDNCPASHTSTGPEFHSQHGGFVWQHGSVSKKGYTAGFVSQTPRLGTSFRYTGPGPGIAFLAWCISADSSDFVQAFTFPVHLKARIKLQAGGTSF